MKKTHILILAFVSAFSFAQEEKELTISPFTGLNVYSGIHVDLIPSNENKMVISGDNVASVVFTLKKDILKIRHSTDKMFKPSNTHIELYFTEKPTQIHSYQGSVIESEESIEAVALDIKAHEGSRQHLKINAQSINSNINSGATLTISGKTTSHQLSIFAGGLCEAEQLLTEQSYVSVTAGGLAYVHARDLMKATVSAGGKIRIHGNPVEIIKKQRLGGIITEMNE